MQNKKARTITFRVDDEVAEGSAGNADKGTRIGYTMSEELDIVGDIIGWMKTRIVRMRYVY